MGTKTQVKLVHSTREKDIVPKPVEPGGVHPELGGQVDSQRESAVHGVVEESPVWREERSTLSAMFLSFIHFFKFHNIYHCLISALLSTSNSVHIAKTSASRHT